MSPTDQDNKTAQNSVKPDFLSEHGIDPEEQRQMEENASTGAASDIAAGSTALSNQDLFRAENTTAGSAHSADEMGFRKEEPRKNIRARFSGMNKRTKAGLGLGVASGIIGILGFMGVGTLQLVHLAQVLSSDVKPSEDDADTRMNALYRYAKSGGDATELRMSFLGSRRFHNNTIPRLESNGVSFRYEKTLGVQTAAVFDLDQNSATKDIKGQQARIKALSKSLGIPATDIKIVNGKAEINELDKKGGGYLRSLNKNIVKQVPSTWYNPTTNRFLTLRSLARAFNVPSMFHPLKRADAAIARKATTLDLARKAAKEMKAGSEYKSSKGSSAYKSLQEKTTGVRAGAGAALLLTASVCMARDSAEDAIVFNREAIAVPQAVEAARVISVGSQQQSGMDFDSSQLNVENRLLADENGKTVWQSAAMMASTSSFQGGGTEVPEELRQAFSGSGNAQNLKSLTDQVGGEYLCSGVGKVAQGAAGVVLLGLSLPSGGTSTAIYGSIRLAAGVAGGAAVMIGIQKLLTETLRDGEVPDDLPADVRGGLLKYGSRELANINARTTGGVELSPEESAMLDREIINKNQSEYNSKPFLAKMFDTSDYRSVASTLVRNHSSPKQDLKNVASSFFNVGPMLASTLKGLSPKANAETETYDYGFNRYGIPRRILNNPAYDDPYANAEVVAGILNSGDKTYIDRAKVCFNVSISKDSGMWEVTPEEGDVNPNSSEYQDAKCNRSDDANWDRVILFVFDNMTMEALACYMGEDDACTKLGANATDGSESSDGSGGTARVSTFNVFFFGNSKKSADVIKNNKFDVVGLQEVRKWKLAEFMKSDLLGDEYESFPTVAGYDKAGYGAQNPIIWKTSTVELVEGSAKSIPGYSINGGKKPDAVIQVKLRLKSTGQEFYFINHHEPVGKGGAIQARFDGASLRAEYVQKLDAPVFLTGDFNSKYGTLKSHEMNQPPLGNKVENLGYCILTAEETNLWDAFDAEQDLAGKCPSANKDGRPGIVDHIYMSREVKVKKGSYNNKIDAPANGSDVHPTVFADIEFPGGGKGSSENITAATYNIQAIGLGGSVEKTKKAAKLMKSEGVTVFGAQEVRQTQFETIKTEGWGGVLTSPDGRAIFWDKNKFTLKRSGQWMITKDGQKKPMIWAELDGGGDKPLYVFNLHTDPSRENTAIRTESARETLAEIKKIVKDESTPFLVTGDMNSNYTDRKEVYNVLKADLLLTYNETKSRIGAECDTVGSKDPRAQQCGSKAPASHIDHIYISKTAKIEVQSWKNIADKNTLAVSDHNPVLVNLRIPSIAAPQENDATGAARMGDDYKNPLCEQFRAKGAPGLSCNGQCVDFVKFRLKKHISRDKFASLGNGKDVVINLGRLGYKVNNKPAVNAVASWGAGQFGMNASFGHTAMVSKVNGDGSIVVEEYNYVGGKYSARKISANQASQLTYAHTEVDFK